MLLKRSNLAPVRSLRREGTGVKQLSVAMHLVANLM